MPNQVEITRQSVAAHNATSPVGAEVMTPLTGQRNHQKVFSTSVNSQLTDAAEEIGMSVAQLGDKRTLGVRTVRRGQGVNLEALTRIAEFYDKLPDMPQQENLRQLIGRFQTFEEALLNRDSRGGSRPTKQDVLALLETFDKDVTHQWAALSLVREFFKKRARRSSAGSDTDLESLLEEAAAEFERTDTMRDVQAGLAAAGVAHKQAPVLGTDPAQIREGYRELLRGSGHFGQLFDSLAGFDLSSKFDDVIDTFIAAAGHDISAAGPSVDRKVLGFLLTELGKLKKMKTVHESVGQLIDSTSRTILELRKVVDQVEMTSRLLHFCSRANVGLTDAKKLVAGLDKASPLGTLTVANGLFELHGQVPDDVMPVIGAKLKQNSALRSLLDVLVDAEEQAYAIAQEADEASRAADRN